MKAGQGYHRAKRRQGVQAAFFGIALYHTSSADALAAFHRIIGGPGYHKNTSTPPFGLKSAFAPPAPLKAIVHCQLPEFRGLMGSFKGLPSRCQMDL